MPYVDFVELKSRVGIEQVAEMLSLQLQRRGAQLRGPCPVCRSGGDRALVITPARQAFYCFGARAGGDLIALVAHMRLPPRHWPVRLPNRPGLASGRLQDQ